MKGHATGGGMTTVGGLALLFLALKLCHVIAWPWLWVLSPFWIPTALAALLILSFAVVYVFAWGADNRARRRRLRERAGGIRPGQHGPAARWRR